MLIPVHQNGYFAGWIPNKRHPRSPIGLRAFVEGLNSEGKVVYSFPQKSNQQISHTDYEDFIKQCTGPAVQKAVDAYYGEYRRITYWQTEILEIKRLQPGSYWFEITLQVKTSKGSFNPPYGIETITLTNKSRSGEGDYKVTKYVHQDVTSL